MQHWMSPAALLPLEISTWELGLQIVAKATLILIVGWMMTAIMRRRSAAVIHLVWMLTLGSLAALPILVSVLPEWESAVVARLDRPERPATVRSEEAATIAMAETSDPPLQTEPTIGFADPERRSVDRRLMSQNEEIPAQPQFAAQAAPIQSAGAQAEAISQESMSAALPLVWIWLAGVCIACLPLVFGVVRLAIIVRRADPVCDPTIISLFEDVHRELSLRRRVRLILSTDQRSPFTWGTIRPVVLIPAEAAGWSHDTLRSVFLHELAHVKRFDVLTQILARLVCGLYWFHPLVWLAARSMRASREAACDDFVLTAGTRPSLYAQNLLELAQKYRPSRSLSAAMVGIVRRSQLEGRMRAILDNRRRRSRVSGLMAALAVAITLASMLPIATAAIVVIRNAEGKEVARIEVPDGGSVSVETDSAAKKTQAATPSRNSSQLGALPGLIPNPAAIEGIRRWQITTAAPRGSIWSVAWAPDGDRVAYAESGNIRICDAKSLAMQQILVGHEGRVTAMEWTPNNRLLASAGDDGTIRIWNADGSLGRVLTGHRGGVNCVAWTSDSERLASAGNDGVVRLWDLDGEELLAIDGHQAVVTSVDWSPDGTQLVASDRNRTVRIWNFDGSPGPEMRGHVAVIRGVAWSPDGEWIASADEGIDTGNDQDVVTSRVQLWRPDGSRGREIVVERDSLNVIAWSPDSTQIAAAGFVGRVHLCDLENESTQQFNVAGWTTYCLAWSPDGDRILAGSRHLNSRVPARVAIRDLKNGQSNSIQARRQGALSVAWNGAGNRLASGHFDGAVRLWDENGERMASLRSSAIDAKDIAFSPDGQLLVSTGDLSHVTLWDLDRNTQSTREGHTSGVYAVAFQPEGTHFVTVGSDRNTFLWNRDDETGKQITGHLHGVTSVDWRPGGESFVTGSFDGTARILDASGNFVRSLEDISSDNPAIRSIAWSPDADTIAAGREDNTIRLWSEQGEPGPLLQGHTGFVETLGWSPDGKWLASGSWDNTVRLWNSKHQTQTVLQNHDGAVFGVAWHPGSRLLASASLDSTVRVWDAETGTAQWLAIVNSDEVSITYDASGTMLNGDAAAMEDELLYLVETPDGAIEILKPSEFETRVKS